MVTDPSLFYWLYSTMAQCFAAILGIMGGFLISRLITLDHEKVELIENAKLFSQINSTIEMEDDVTTKVIKKHFAEKNKKLKGIPKNLKLGFGIFLYLLFFGVFVLLIFLANNKLIKNVNWKTALLIINGIGVLALIYYFIDFVSNIFPKE